VSIFGLAGDGSSLQDLTLDGNKANQIITPDENGEHRHGVFTHDGANIQISNITAQNFTGDGIYLSVGLTNTTVTGSTSQNNKRHGITLGASQTGTVITNNHLAGNTGQQIDGEPMGADLVNDATVANNRIEAPAGLYAVTIGGTSGSTTATQGTRWSVHDNTITGSLRLTWMNTVTLANNTITVSDDKSCVEVNRNSSDITISGNTLAQTGPARNVSGVYIVGTSTANMPSKISVTGNHISVANTTAFGVRATGTIDVTVTGNTITGPTGGTDQTYAGATMRATLTGRHSERFVVTDNTINGFARGVGVSGDKTKAWIIEELDVARNTINSSHGVGLDPTNDTPGALLVMGSTWGPGVALPHISPASSNTTIIASDEPITVVPATP